MAETTQYRTRRIKNFSFLMERFCKQEDRFSSLIDENVSLSPEEKEDFERHRNIGKEIERLLEEMDQVARSRIQKYVDKYLLTGSSEFVKVYFEAVAHQLLGIEPKTEKLGYKLADFSGGTEMGIIYDIIARNGGKLEATLEEKEDMIRVSDYFDFSVSDYIFNHTHYDESSNGWFFRRS